MGEVGGVKGLADREGGSLRALLKRVARAAYGAEGKSGRGGKKKGEVEGGTEKEEKKK